MQGTNNYEQRYMYASCTHVNAATLHIDDGIDLLTQQVLLDQSTISTVLSRLQVDKRNGSFLSEIDHLQEIINRVHG